MCLFLLSWHIFGKERFQERQLAGCCLATGVVLGAGLDGRGPSLVRNSNPISGPDTLLKDWAGEQPVLKTHPCSHPHRRSLGLGAVDINGRSMDYIIRCSVITTPGKGTTSWDHPWIEMEDGVFRRWWYFIAFFFFFQLEISLKIAFVGKGDGPLRNLSSLLCVVGRYKGLTRIAISRELPKCKILKLIGWFLIGPLTSQLKLREPEHWVSSLAVLYVNQSKDLTWSGRMSLPQECF